MNQSDLDSFLHRIAQIESSGGRNTHHQMVKVGPLKGEKAIGMYGLMPSTIQTVLVRKAQDGTITPDLEALKGENQNTVRNLLSTRPDLEHNIAQSLANYVLQRQNGNDLAGAYSWNQGTNLSPNQITQNKLLNSPYTEKYQQLKNQESIQQIPTVTNNPQMNALVRISNPDETDSDLQFIRRLQPDDLDNDDIDNDSNDLDNDAIEKIKNFLANQ